MAFCVSTRRLGRPDWSMMPVHAVCLKPKLGPDKVIEFLHRILVWRVGTLCGFVNQDQPPAADGLRLPYPVTSDEASPLPRLDSSSSRPRFSASRNARTTSGSN